MAFNDDPRKAKTTRKAKQAHGGGVDGTRTVVTDDTLLQEFEVSSKAALCDNLGIKRYPGQMAMLDETTAQWMAERGYIKVEIKLDVRKARPARRAKADADAEAGDAAAPDPEETVVAPTADPDGGKSGGGDAAPDVDEPASEDKPRSRRQRNL